jgi:hypothetical protein
LYKKKVTEEKHVSKEKAKEQREKEKEKRA